MPPPSVRSLISQIPLLADPRLDREAADEECLRRFIFDRDEESFAALVRRHGPMVLGVCRRVLHDGHLAEDVVQAVFLVLARKATSVRKIGSLGSWLHGVAFRLARRAKADALRRRDREARAEMNRSSAVDVGWREYLDLLDEELARLSESCRAPLVLCYLEGRTRDEAARRLGWSLRTLDRRLERGRRLLRTRLLGRGVALGGMLFGVALTRPALAAGLAAAVVRAATGRGAASGGVTALAERMIRELSMTKLKTTLAAVLTMALVALGAGVWAHQTLAPRQQTGAAKEEKPAPDSRPTTDRYGDPLPESALLRLGTLRMRHDCFTSCATFSPDGKTVIVGDAVGRLTFWDAADGKERRRVDTMSGTVSDLASSADGKKLVSGHRGKLMVWDAMMGARIDKWDVENDPIQQVLLTPDGAAAAVRYQGKFIDLWSLTTGKRLHRLEGHTGNVAALALSPDGKTLASAAWQDPNVRLWEVATGKEVRAIKAADTDALAVAFAPDGKTLATCGNAEPVRFWDPATGKLVREGEDRYAAAMGLAYVADGKGLAGMCAQKVVIWDAATGKVLRESEGEPRNMGHLKASPDGKMIVTCWGGPYTFDLWDPATGKLVHAFEGHRERVTALAFAPDGRTLFSGAEITGEPLLEWDLSTGKPARRLGKYPAGARDLALSPNGGVLAACDSNQTIGLWDPVSGKEVGRLKGHGSIIVSASFSGDGKTLLTASHYDKTMRLWDVAAGKELRSIPFEQSWPCAAVLSPDGQVIAAGGFQDGAVRLWDAATGKDVRTLTTPHLIVYTVAFSPDGTTLATGGMQGPVCLWNPADRKLVRQFTVTGWTGRVAFSPDGHTLAAGTNDGRVSLFETATGGLRAQFAGHRGGINALAFAPDGRRVASGGEDTSILVWDVVGGIGTAEDLDGLWKDLSGSDAARAHRAVWSLAAVPEKAVPLLAERVKHGVAPTAATRDRVAGLVKQLDSEEFATRRDATAELEKLGPDVEPLLREAMNNDLSAEATSRIRKLLDGIESATQVNRLRQARVLEVLEHVGTPEARTALSRWADGEPGASLTAGAKAALKRLDLRHPRR